MTVYHASLQWIRTTPDFQYQTFNRTHMIRFGGGHELKASSSPEYFGKAEQVNPEECFLASISSCHMLTFLALAAKSRYVVEEYQDDAEAVLGKNSKGKLSMLNAVLRPKVVFSGENIPGPDELKALHEKAHIHCFISNSITTEVKIEIRT